MRRRTQQGVSVPQHNKQVSDYPCMVVGDDRRSAYRVGTDGAEPVSPVPPKGTTFTAETLARVRVGSGGGSGGGGGGARPGERRRIFMHEARRRGWTGAELAATIAATETTLAVRITQETARKGDRACAALRRVLAMGALADRSVNVHKYTLERAAAALGVRPVEALRAICLLHADDAGLLASCPFAAEGAAVAWTRAMSLREAEIAAGIRDLFGGYRGAWAELETE